MTGNDIPAMAQRYGFSGTSQDYCRFLLNFDAHAAACAVQGAGLQRALSGPGAPAGWEGADRFKEEFLRRQRKYFYFSLQGKPVNVFYTAFRGAVHMFLLCRLAQGVPPGQWEGLLNQWARQFPPAWLGANCRQIQADYLSELRRMQQAAGPAELEHLRRCLGQLEAFGAGMERALGSAAPREESRTAGGSPALDRLTNRQKVSLACFLECAEHEGLREGERWNSLLGRKWAELFPAAPYGRAEELWLARALDCRLPGQGERSRVPGRGAFPKYCRAMGAALEHGGVGSVNSAVYMNSLLLMRAVLMTMACTSLDTLAGRTEDTLLADVLGYLENVTYLAPDGENEIILEYIRLFRPNGDVDRECVLTAQKYRPVLSKNFSAICKAVELKNRNIRQVSNLSDRLKEMESSLCGADFDVKRDMVLRLDRGSYGHRLGELYRFAQGLDQRSPQQVRELLECFFQLLNTLGITPACQERLDQPIGEGDALYDRMAPEGGPAQEGDRVLRYPGWSVQGVQVAPPVYTVKQGGNDS